MSRPGPSVRHRPFSFPSNRENHFGAEPHGSKRAVIGQESGVRQQHAKKSGVFGAELSSEALNLNRFSPSLEGFSISVSKMKKIWL